MEQTRKTNRQTSELDTDCNEELVKANCLVEDFEIQYGKLSSQAQKSVNRKVSVVYLLYFIDLLVSFLVIGPCVVAFWRCVWNYHDLFLDGPVFDRDNLTLSNVVAISVGLLGTFLIDVFHHSIARCNFIPKPLKLSVMPKLFSIIWGTLDITYWKGVWDGVDLWAGKTVQVAGITLLIGMICLLMLGAVRTAICSPIGISLDDPRRNFCCATYLKSSSETIFLKRCIDGILSRIVKLNVILLWHGIWKMSDILTEDKDYWRLSHQQSAWFSLGVGGVGAVFLFCSQFGLLKLQTSLHGLFFQILLVIFYLLGVFTTVSSFRGFWLLLDVFYLPQGVTGDPTPSSILTAGVIGTLLLLLLGCGSSVRAPTVRDDPVLGIAVPFFFTAAFYVRKHEDKAERKMKLMDI
eukprot:GFUD01019994.1.p1 GENE.GFUD01019994.1~~GFUD01019994.1.p1  ORF type:complete len:407 (+),score=61.26 GFUD01019994.1:95-1315(+)